MLIDHPDYVVVYCMPTGRVFLDLQINDESACFSNFWLALRLVGVILPPGV